MPRIIDLKYAVLYFLTSVFSNFSWKKPFRLVHVIVNFILILLFRYMNICDLICPFRASSASLLTLLRGSSLRRLSFCQCPCGQKESLMKLFKKSCCVCSRAKSCSHAGDQALSPSCKPSICLEMNAMLATLTNCQPCQGHAGLDSVLLARVSYFSLCSADGAGGQLLALWH